MANKTTRDATREEAEIQLTPMIDVTFLLLIFFLCSIKFKWLDGKLSTYLPKDEGIHATTDPMELERIEIHLTRAPRQPMGFEIALGDSRLSGLKELYQRIRGLYEQDSTLRATCYPGEGIQHQHVVKVVNECMRADLKNISFSGVEE